MEYHLDSFLLLGTTDADVISKTRRLHTRSTPWSSDMYALNLLKATEGGGVLWSECISANIQLNWILEEPGEPLEEVKMYGKVSDIQGTFTPGEGFTGPQGIAHTTRESESQILQAKITMRKSRISNYWNYLGEFYNPRFPTMEITWGNSTIQDFQLWKLPGEFLRRSEVSPRDKRHRSEMRSFWWQIKPRHLWCIY